MTKPERMTDNQIMPGTLMTNVYLLRQGEFDAIPGRPWVYWISNNIREVFRKHNGLGNDLKPIHGSATYDNFRFLRFWWETKLEELFFNCRTWDEFISSEKKYVPYMKGGSAIGWYGNQETVLALTQKGQVLQTFLQEKNDQIRGEQFIFTQGITWSDISSKGFQGRYLPPGFIFDVQGSSGFPASDLLGSIISLMNSSWSQYCLKLLNATLHHQVGDISRLPFTKPIKEQKEILDKYVQSCIRIRQAQAFFSEDTFQFFSPPHFINGCALCESNEYRLARNERNINNEIYEIYGISLENRKSIEAELFGNLEKSRNGENDIDESYDDLSENRASITSNEIALNWFSYAIGTILNHFFPSQSGKLGSAIIYQSNFAIGSFSQPSKEEFDELVGTTDQFAYIDEKGGRHVFSQEAEKALESLAIPNGIAVFDIGHSRDLAALVHKALIVMLGEQGAQEVIDQAAVGDLRKYLEKDYFTQYHLKLYRKRPVYWYIQSAKRNYGFVIFHERITRDTFYSLQRDPYLDTKRRAVELEIADLQAALAGKSGSERKKLEKQLAELHSLADELTQFAKDLEEITRSGYEPAEDWIDDGVILRMAPLWKVIPLWKSEPKKYWERLEAGDFDWSHIAMCYWPERVKDACKKNKSFAIAHGHEEWYEGR
ncbi:MAG: hypothetical protein PHQ40_03650 [Anaerolineaceae bacterium]|nr:hypothetical protein [Anaerolineaceae bacterium]